MKTPIQLLMMIAALLFSGCKKDVTVDDSPLLIPQAVKDYSFFLPGTYWVYIDSVSGRVDSIYVYETAHSYDTLHYDATPRTVFEIYVVKAHSYMDGYDYYIEANATYSVNDPNYFDIFEEKLKPGDYVGRTVLFIHKPYKNQVFYWGNSTNTVLEVYPSILLNGSTYKDVVQIYHDISAIDVSNHATNFIAKNYFIVRKEYADSNQVWELARSHIIQ
jgi:hypothetical protein